MFCFENLDTYIAYLNDDAIAMFMLSQADKAGMLEFLGVTTTGGNVFVPEAICQCLAVDWKSQLIVPDDLTHLIHLTPSVYDRLAEAEQNSITELLLDNKRTFNSDASSYVWDVVVPAERSAGRIISTTIWKQEKISPKVLIGHLSYFP